MSNMNGAQTLADFLREEQVPTALVRDLQFETRRSPARVWPPAPGCCHYEDIGVVRIWAPIDLAQWIRLVPHVFGPHYPDELHHLAHAGARLRAGGEGAQVLWALDLVTPNQWVSHARTAFAVSELVTYGPLLPDELVAAADNVLSHVGWTESTADANQPCVVNRVQCYETSWHGGETYPTRPPAGPPHP